MLVVENFLATGTQMRLELPGKGCVTVPVDSIEPPVVLLKDGSIVRVSLKSFPQLKGNIEKILFLGDILISFGDFLYTSKALSPSGYVEEWWIEDVNKAIAELFEGDFEKVALSAQIPQMKLEAFLKEPFSNVPTAKEAMLLSLHLKVPLHPKYTFFWSNLSSAAEVALLRDWLLASEVVLENELAHRVV